MPVSPEMQERGKQMLRDEIKRQNQHASETQVNAAFDKLLASERIKSALEYGSDTWDMVPAHVAGLVRDGLKDHDGIKPIPSAADYVAFRLPQMLKVFGEAARPDLMLSLYREAQGMSDAELIASGAPVGAAATVRELDDTVVKTLHQRDYSWHGWQAEIGRVTGQHPANVLPSRQREIIDKLRDESRRAANGGLNDADIATKAAIMSKAPEQRSAEERMTLARLGG